MSLVWHYVIVCLCFFSWTNPETDRQTDRLSTEELKGTVANVPSHTPSQETVPSSAVLDGISAPISLTHQHWPRCSPLEDLHCREWQREREREKKGKRHKDTLINPLWWLLHDIFTQQADKKTGSVSHCFLFFFLHQPASFCRNLSCHSLGCKWPDQTGRSLAPDHGGLHFVLYGRDPEIKHKT